MDIVFHKIFYQKLFIFGLILKLFLLVFFIPEIQNKLFVPFFENFFLNPHISPWSSFAAGQTELNPYPYGLVMFIMQLPFVSLGYLFDDFFLFDFFTRFSIGLSILFFDTLLLLTLIRLSSAKSNKLITFYWLSPVVILICYWHGQIDVIPIFLLFLGLLKITTENLKQSALLIALSISAKFSMLVVLPFILIFLYKRGYKTRNLIEFLTILLLLSALFYLPVIYDQGFYQLVFNNKETDRIFTYFVQVRSNLNIYFLPLIYSIFLYYIYKLKNINFDLFLGIVGVTFSIFLIFSPAPVGWFFWFVPFLALHLSNGHRNTIILGQLFSFYFLFYHLFFSTGAIYIFNSVNFIENIQHFVYQYESLIFTIFVALLILVITKFFIEEIQNNIFFTIGKKPIVFEIKGTSSKLNSVFLNMFSQLFKDNEIFYIGKSEYDKYSNREIYKVNRINELNINEIYPIIRRKRVISICYQDKFFNNIINEIQDISFFLDYERNKSTNRNNEDSESNIEFYLPDDLNQNNHSSYIKVILNRKYYSEEISKILVGLCGLHVQWEGINSFENKIELRIQGQISSEDVKFAIKSAVPYLMEIIDINYLFHSGVFGLIELVTLLEIDQALKKRRFFHFV